MNTAMRLWTRSSFCALSLFLVCFAPRPGLSDCSLTNTGIKPLPEIGLGVYQGFSGGLYPNAGNSRPPAHLAAGLIMATNRIQPLDSHGNPTNTGKIALLSIGMSNT